MVTVVLNSLYNDAGWSSSRCAAPTKPIFSVAPRKSVGAYSTGAKSVARDLKVTDSKPTSFSVANATLAR